MSELTFLLFSTFSSVYSLSSLLLLSATLFLSPCQNSCSVLSSDPKDVFLHPHICGAKDPEGPSTLWSSWACPTCTSPCSLSYSSSSLLCHTEATALQFTKPASQSLPLQTNDQWPWQRHFYAKLQKMHPNLVNSIIITKKTKQHWNCCWYSFDLHLFDWIGNSSDIAIFHRLFYETWRPSESMDNFYICTDGMCWIPWSFPDDFRGRQ